MYKNFQVISVIFFVWITVGCITPKRDGPVIPDGAFPGIAFVELFTSEGCSSCPPADAVIARLLAKKQDRVFILAYHVDYWNRLGWKDPFSSAEFSKRQNDYASSLQLQSIYTPQVIVNGTTEFVGSDEGKLIAAVKQNLAGTSAISIDVDIKKTGDHLELAYKLKGDHIDNQLLNVALLQNEATTSVKKGENAGKTLPHVNIVRTLKSIIAKNSGVVTMDIAGDLAGNELQLIAFTQATGNGRVSGATQKSL